jgi:UTP:GlnB (protein PII) uridylyltransferase
VVTAEAQPVVADLEEMLRTSLRRPPTAPPVPDATVFFDAVASPWHTLCRVEAPDRPGLLHAITSAFAAAGANVHSARVTTVGPLAVDLFELTDRNGKKLDPVVEEAVRRLVVAGMSAPLRGPSGRFRSMTARRRTRTHGRSRDDINTKQSGDRQETSAP